MEYPDWMRNQTITKSYLLINWKCLTLLPLNKHPHSCWVYCLYVSSNCYKIKCMNMYFNTKIDNYGHIYFLYTCMYITYWRILRKQTASYLKDTLIKPIEPFKMCLVVTQIIGVFSNTVVNWYMEPVSVSLISSLFCAKQV